MKPGLTASRLIDDSGRLNLPFIWIATGLSLILHAIALAPWWPHTELRIAQFGDEKGFPSRMRLRLLPDASPPPARAVPNPPARTRLVPQRVPQAVPAPPRVPAPPVIALNQPAPSAPAVPAPAPAQPTAPAASAPATPQAPTAPAPPAPSRPAAGGDFMAALEARRRARGETGGPPGASLDEEKARRDRIVAANLGQDRAPAFGQDPRNQGGGVFQIRRLGINDAEFQFYGWNKNIGRTAAQTIEVQRGNNPDIQIAIVRKMISIIREHETGDFTWDSRRLGRTLNLSARPADNAGLEEVLMREFFDVRR